MRTYFRTLRYGGPYGKLLPLFFISLLLGIIFQTLSFGSMAPILKVLFKPEETMQVVTWDQAPPFSFSLQYLENIVSWGKIYLSSGQDKLESLKVICTAIIVGVFFSNLFLFLSKYISAFVKSRMTRKLRVAAFNKITRLHISYFSNERRGDIISRLTNDMYEVETTFVSSFYGLIKEPLTIIIIFSILFSMSYKLTLFTIIILPVSGFFISIITKKLRKKAIKGQTFLGKILGMVDETINGIKIIKSFNAEEQVKEKFLKENKIYQRTLFSLDYKKDLASPVSQFLGTTVVALILYFGGSLVLKGEVMAPENFILFVIFFGMIITPIKGIVNVMSVIQRGLIAANRIFEIIDTVPLIENKKDAVALKAFENSIELKNVGFAYNEEMVLKDINLEVKKGMSVALVGPSGGGKSTLADLIPRFHDVGEGELCIDSKNIKDYTFESVRDQMSIVTQESILFNDTIFNNIAFGKTNATKEEVYEAARVANAHDFILEQDHGYDTEIGDHGMKLSGGQKQRLSIARAILKNPPILILDEATSALDTQSEKLVQEALTNLMENRTSIVIAHRLSTIQSADMIVVIEGGNIIERGTHEDLLAKGGRYADLRKLQS